jgi:hypothetical protein
MSRVRKATVRQEQPIDEIQKAIGNGASKGTVMLSRLKPGGGYSNLKHEIWELSKLGGPDFLDWIEGLYGGGPYVIDVRNPDNHMDNMGIPKWKMELAGEVKNPPGSPFMKGNGPSEMFPLDQIVPNGPGSPGYPIGTWGNKGPVPPGFMWPPEANQHPRESPVVKEKMASYTSDQAFKMQADGMTQQMYALQTRMENMERERREERRQAEIRERQLRDDAQRIKDEATEERRRMEQNMWEEKMKLLSQTAKQKPSMDLASVFTALAPVLTAFITVGKEKEALSQQQHYKSLEMQNKNADTMVKLMAGNAKSDMGVMQTMMPMLMKIMDSQSSKSQAEAMSMTTESQLGLLSMLNQVIQSQVPSDQPEWAKLAESTISGVGNVLQSVVASRQAAAQAAAAQGAIPSGVSAAAGLGTGAPTQQPEQEQPTPEDQMLELSKAIMADENYPEDMRTDEWRQILVMVHSRYDEQVVAQHIFEHLNGLYDTQKMPELFTTVWTAPLDRLSTWLGYLPVSQIDLPYAQRLATKFAEIVAAVIAAEEAEGTEQQQQEPVGDIIDAPPEQETAPTDEFESRQMRLDLENDEVVEENVTK